MLIMMGLTALCSSCSDYLSPNSFILILDSLSHECAYNHDHCCSQVDKVQNADSGIIIPLIKFPDKFCHPHCHLEDDILDQQINRGSL
jgi:hypothetical protein